MEKAGKTDLAPDAYRHFRSHIELVDFDKPVFDALVEEPATDEQYHRCQAAADDISYQLLGLLDDKGNKIKPEYWSEPEFAGMSPLDIEISILREQRRAQYGLESRFGIPAYRHGLIAMKQMFPPTDITPVLADIVHLSFLAYSYGRKYLHLLGSMDAGKSSSTARLAMLYMKIDPENTFGVVANPLLESADMTIYGDIAELFEQLCKHHSLPDSDVKGTLLFRDATVEAKRRINFIKNARGKGGWIALRSLKKEGVAIGAKGKGKDDRFGHGLFIFDEINRVENLRFKTDLVNISAQGYFQMHSTQNPWDEQDVGGMMASPKPWREWGWNSYDQIRQHQPVIWPTVDSGIAYRINGLDAVNIRLGKVVYPYQFRRSKLLQIIEDKGETSPEYYSQVLGIFPGGDIDMRLLSQARLSASRHDDEFFSLRAVKGRVLFCDPAHTGTGDNAVIGTAEFGPALIANTDGKQTGTDLFVVRKPMEYVKFINGIPWQTGATGDPRDFSDRFEALGGNFNNITAGAMVSYEQQIALRMAEIAKDENIPARNIGYDYSMRPEMVEAVTAIIGVAPVAFNYNTKPIGYELHATKEKTEDKCKSRIDELAYLTADVFRSKQLRGGQLILAAIIQLCKTRIQKDKPGNPIEKKPEFKLRNGNKSPDERDTLMGEIGMAFLRGFRAEGNKTAGDSSDASIFRRTRKLGHGIAKTGKRLTYNSN